MTPANAPSLTESSRSVLRLLALRGEVTRRQLGDTLNLSKPTMSAAIAELGALGLVQSTGSHKGAMGRTAVVYGLGPQAGYAIGVDVGAAQIRAVAHALDGQQLASVESKVPRGQNASTETISATVLDVVRSAISAVGQRQSVLRSIAVAVPRVVATSPLHLNKRRPPEAVLAGLRSHFDVPVIIENNVNCAALGEWRHGAGRNRATFAFVQVGVRIGLGIVINGQLFRGVNGASGEVGRLPFPWSTSEVPEREGLEHYLGSDALIERCAVAWPLSEGPAPLSARELFEMAEDGSELARSWVFRHAADVGRLLSGVVGVLDPGLVVLGGGVGQNPLLLGEVRKVTRDLTWATEIEVSRLGNAGTVLGAVQLAIDYGLGLILGEAIHPSVALPPLI
ncbi:ROK family transcriptional regulator [Devosia riboflavina]|uniref:ROK family transcriptional regulator n=2 Tax=Devosia riboflavina TaxID=46914 RepID=A0A087LZG6_9HYPH|nr:ROK family transcriptional regulator [Devosia riboflavina]